MNEVIGPPAPPFGSFDAWFIDNPDLVEEQTVIGIDCAECDGAAGTPCFACGQERDCEACGGTGIDTLPSQETIRQHMHRFYLKQKARDVGRLIEWNRLIAQTRTVQERHP